MGNKFKLYIIIIIALISCDEPSYVYQFPDTTNEEVAQLSKVGVKRILLDSTLGIENQSIVYYDDPTPRVSILNGALRRIHVFDYENGRQLYTIPLEYEGKNGLGNISNMGHYMINEDSIFLTNHWENRLYIINKKGKVKTKFNLKPNVDSPNFYLMNNSISKMHLSKSHIYISVQSSFQPKLESCYLLKLNLQDSTVSYHINEPNFLTNHFWGVLTPFQFSTTFLEDTVVTSFAKNPDLEVYSLNDLKKPLSRHTTGSKFVSSFKSFSKKNTKPTLYGYSYNQIAPLTNRQAMFTSIDFIPKSKNYLRTMLLPRTVDQYEMRLNGMRLTYIILNNKFDKIGETKMPRGRYSYKTYFINNKGLHIANIEEYAKDENTLTFDIYEITYN